VEHLSQAPRPSGQACPPEAEAQARGQDKGKGKAQAHQGEASMGEVYYSDDAEVFTAEAGQLLLSLRE